MSRGLVSEPAGAEMHTHPDSIFFVGKNIDVMIAAADRAELACRGRFQFAHRGHLPRRIVEEFVIDPRLAFLTNAERNIADDVVHDFLHRRRDLDAGSVRSYGEVATGDIEADTGEGVLI